jgi:hypothetical protein
MEILLLEHLSTPTGHNVSSIARTEAVVCDSLPRSILRSFDFTQTSPPAASCHRSTPPGGRGILSRGTQNKSDGPLRGWLVPRRPKKYQGWSDGWFFIVFLNSPHRETPKNVIKKTKINCLRFFSDFFVKAIRHDFCYTFFVVILNSHRKEPPEKAIKKGQTTPKFLSIF